MRVNASDLRLRLAEADTPGHSPEVTYAEDICCNPRPLSVEKGHQQRPCTNNGVEAKTLGSLLGPGQAGRCGHETVGSSKKRAVNAASVEFFKSKLELNLQSGQRNRCNSIKTVNIGWRCGSGECTHSAGLDSPAQQKTSNVFLAKLVWLFFPPAYAKIHRELQDALNSQNDLDGCSGDFSPCCNKIPDKSNLRKEAFIPAHRLRVQPPQRRRRGDTSVRRLLTLHPQATHEEGEHWGSARFLLFTQSTTSA